MPPAGVEILILINEPENAPEAIKQQNQKDLAAVREWIGSKMDEQPRWLVFHRQLPAKQAGVGLARKILMDEAAWRLDLAGNGNGVITGLDADCTVSPDYLTGLYDYFMASPDIQGASLYYEHPLNGPHALAIAEYELHLRYYVYAQRSAGAQYAHQTLGSAMAVRNHCYQRVGGMNRRKAGEDFYFLQKVMPFGYGEIRSLCVFPSARVSHRVPFGTGKAMKSRMEEGTELLSYSPRSFIFLRELYDHAFLLQPGDVHPVLWQFLLQQNYASEYARIFCDSREEFSRRFHLWFDGFRLMKALHFLRDQEESCHSVPVSRAASWLVPEELKKGSVQDLLGYFRQLDRFTG